MKLIAWLWGSLFLFCGAGAALASPAEVKTQDRGDSVALIWKGDETIEVSISMEKGLYKAPVKVRVDDREISFEGFYVHINEIEEGYSVESTQCTLKNGGIEVEQVLRHPLLSAPEKLGFTLSMEPQDRGLRVDVTSYGEGQHLDRLGIGDMSGEGLSADRMFFGRMYVLDRPQAFEVEHNYNTCKAWCWKMENGLSALQATDGPAKGFRYDPEKGRYDLFTYCESPIHYLLLFTGKGPQEAIAEYRSTIHIPAPPTLSQLPGRVGVMTAYPIMERYEDFLNEWTGRGARDFVWLSYFPTPGDRARVEKYGALYATYDIYLDAFKEGPRKMEGWTPEIVQYRGTGKMVRGYWSSSWLLPDQYVKVATTRVMGVFGREFRNDKGENDFVNSPATRYSNLAITKAEVNPSGLYLDVHASKAPHHYFDYQAGHHGAWEHMKGEKALFDFARDYLGNVPIWSEGGGEDYAGLMDGGWFMDWRPPQELGINCAGWEYYPFVDQIHRERLLNMGIYYPLDHYDPDMVNAAILFGRPQAVSVYYGSLQDDVAGRLQVYYMTKAFHQMLGLSRLERVDFQDEDIHCPVVSFSNGARVWSNRSTMDWEVEGYTLPPMGYLIRGPEGFLEYRARQEGEIVDVVRSQGYDYFACPQRRDFGPIAMDGAVALVEKEPNRLMVYEVLKPKSGIALKLGEARGTTKGQKAIEVHAVLTRDRSIPLSFPDFRQPPDPQDPSQPGSIVEVRPAEMRETVGYEVVLGR